MSGDTRTPLTFLLDSAMSEIFQARDHVTDAVSEQMLTDARSVLQAVINREQAAQEKRATQRRDQMIRDAVIASGGCP